MMRFECRYGMIEAISHLIHRDYEAIVQDFITLRFIPKGEGCLCLMNQQSAIPSVVVLLVVSDTL